MTNIPLALCAKAGVYCESLTSRPQLEPARESIFVLTLLKVNYNAIRWCGQRVFSKDCVQGNKEFSFEINHLPRFLWH